MRLTPNQQETLLAVVHNNVGGQIEKPIPSLIKHGLVVRAPTPTSTTLTEPTFGFRGSLFQHTLNHRPRYLLTPLGLETVEKILAKHLELSLKEVQEKHDQALAKARTRTT